MSSFDSADVVWLPDGRPSKEMVQKGIYREVTVGWQPLTLQFVPRVSQLVDQSGDDLIAGSLAYRWAVCFDKFACGGDVRDSSEARQLLNELRGMGESDEDPAKNRHVDEGLDGRIDDAMNGDW